MKGLSVIIAAFILVFGTLASRGANVDRISAETGVPAATLQAERASVGQRSGLLTHTAATESVSLCMRMKGWLRLWNSKPRFGDALSFS